jgi:hypothetical protein
MYIYKYILEYILMKYTKIEDVTPMFGMGRAYCRVQATVGKSNGRARDQARFQILVSTAIQTPHVIISVTL